MPYMLGTLLLLLPEPLFFFDDDDDDNDTTFLTPGLATLFFVVDVVDTSPSVLSKSIVPPI